MSDQETQMFGLSIKDMVAGKPEFYSNGLYAMSILSDVQEVLHRLCEVLTSSNIRLKLSDEEMAMIKRDCEIGRQWLNKAKYFIGQNTDTEGRVV